jgi:hypothetical protein
LGLSGFVQNRYLFGVEDPLFIVFVADGLLGDVQKLF